MNRLLSLWVCLLLFGIGGQVVTSGSNVPSQDQQPVSTLIPPTPVPRSESGDGERLPNVSTIARLQANGVVQVGVLFNAPPFGELNLRGELAGFDVDLARSMVVDTWGLEIQFVQVTRNIEENVRLLRAGELDMLVAGLVNHRDLSSMLEFSQTYYLGRKVMMVRSGDGEPNALFEMSGRSVGVVVATPAEAALMDWINRTGIGMNVLTYLTLDQAYVALLNGEIDGVVDSAHRLSQVSAVQPQGVRFIEEYIELEPYAIGIVRQDAPMHDLVNRTLQYLTATGRMDEIHQIHFTGQGYEPLLVWNGLGEEAPSPSDYSTALAFPQAYTLGRLAANPVVRVAGLIGVTADVEASESDRRLDTFHRQLIQEMVARWGMTAEFIPDSYNTAIDLVAAGEADLAVGLSPSWDVANSVDFSSSYLRHGERLMIRVADVEDFSGFGSLANETLMVPNNDAMIASYAVSIAEENNWRIDITQQREGDLGFLLLGGDEDVEAEAVFADSFMLVPHVQANLNELTLTLNQNGEPRWYGPSQMVNRDFTFRTMSFALPENDIDFQLLVDYTLQELARDGTLATLLQQVMLTEEIPVFEIWPGPTNYLNYSLVR